MKVHLRPIQQSDFASMISWVRTREEMIQWSGPWNFDFPLDEHQVGKFFLTQVLDDRLHRMQFVAVDDDTQQRVGQIGFSRIWVRTRSAHLGPVIVAPAFRHQGIGSQMVRDMLTIGFRQLQLHRIELVVFDFNEVAIRCYERVGFQTEGRLRDICQVGNEYWHWRAMSVLEHEFPSTNG